MPCLADRRNARSFPSESQAALAGKSLSKMGTQVTDLGRYRRQAPVLKQLIHQAE